MIKLFSLIYDYYFFLLRGGISLLLYQPYPLTIISERYRLMTQIHFQGLCGIQMIAHLNTYTYLS